MILDKNDNLTTFGALVICVVMWIVLAGVALGIETMFATYNDGIPKTHNGHVIYVAHHYNKFRDYEWTDVEILTYSGDSHHIYFWGHVDLEMGTNYHLHTIVDYRFILAPIPTWHTKQLITEVEIIETS